jgi:TolB-like protein/DNA-binding winged helix-turn-helix (wHTH) protein/tetratricopeptide (TPR) repeat protein
MGLPLSPLRSGQLSVYRFETFTLDLGKGCLYSGEDEVRLRPKTFEALRYVVENAGRLVLKEELVRAVWPDSFVSDNSLAQCFLEIRKALSDDDQRIIKTVQRRGYLFNVPAEKAPPGLTEPVAQRPVEYPSTGMVRGGRLKWIGWAAILTLVAAAIGVSILVHARSTPATQLTLAVLPFQSLAGSESDEFLELGMADALITRLSNVREIAVRPTSAVRSYTDQKRDPLQIAKQLRVEYVLEGGVQEKDGRIRVTVQLIGMPEGKPIWAEHYDEASGDIFAVQDAVSTRVAAALAPKLTGNASQRLQKKSTSDVEAFRLYSRGRYFWSRRTNEDLSKALGYFKEAIRRDEKFALAYAAAAQCYPPMIIMGFRKLDDGALNEMRHYVDGAMRLDPEIGEAHVAQATLRMFEWNWPGAEDSFQRSIQLNSNDPLAHIWYGYFLEAMGRQEENLAERTRGWELDPLSWNAAAGVGSALGMLGRHDEAIRQLQSALELNPNYYFTRLNLGEEYLAKRMLARAIEEFRVAPDVPSLGFAYALNGQADEAQRTVERMRANPLSTSLDYAFVSVGLGRTSEALDLLDQAYREHIPGLMFLRVDERLASLRGNQRFEAIAAAMKIPAPAH